MSDIMYEFKDAKLFSLLKSFVFNAEQVISEAIGRRFYVAKYPNYPRIEYSGNGMPNILEYSVDAPVDISFISNDEIKNTNGYLDLFEYLKENNEFKLVYFLNYGTEEQAIRYYEASIRVFIFNILERYYLLNKDNVNKTELLSAIYIPIENMIYNKKLYFDIAVPILFVNFGFDEYHFNDNIKIQKISEDHHKARVYVKSYSPPVTTALISSATHELVLKNYSLEKPIQNIEETFSVESIYPHSIFEYFFNALKICFDFDSGYAQVIVYPYNWADYYKMDLPYILGTSVKRYPTKFDNFYWVSDTLPYVSIEQIEYIKEVYLLLLKSEETNKKLKVACKRLRYSYLRDNEDDSIIDILIALETLLSDNDRGEITYKLSLRMAKLFELYSDQFNPFEVFESMKKIYSYRSSVVHGAIKVNSKRELKINNNSETIGVVNLANNYLRTVLNILIKHPIYLDSKEIDKLLLNSKISN